MNKKEFKLTADYVGISEDGENFGLFYTLVEDEAFEKLTEELSKAGELKLSDESGYYPDEVEDWFLDHSRITEFGATAKEIYNPTISREDIRVKCTETREALVNGVKFTVTATDSMDEMYKNKEAQKMLKRG